MESIIQDALTSGCFLSDHLTVQFNVKGFQSEPSAKDVWFRRIKLIDLRKFKQDLRDSELFLNTHEHLVDLVNSYNTTLKSITDKHAPLRKRSMTTRRCVPWLSNEIRSVKSRRRIAERRWRSTKSESDWRTFKNLRNMVVYLMNKSRREFYTDLISSISGDQRRLFATTKKLLNQPAEMLFPPHSDKVALANDMESFFDNKITDIRASLDNSDNLYSIANRQISCSSSITDFRGVDINYVKKLVLSAPTKSCLLDPVPTGVLKDCFDELLPILSTMVNISLQSGSFPDVWKESLVTPLL